MNIFDYLSTMMTRTEVEELIKSAVLAEREACVKVCHIYADKYIDGDIADTLAKDIAALPVPEFKWVDLTEDEIREIAKERCGSPNADFTRAVIAKFKKLNSLDISQEHVEKTRTSIHMRNVGSFSSNC